MRLKRDKESMDLIHAFFISLKNQSWIQPHVEIMWKVSSKSVAQGSKYRPGLG